MNKLIYAVFPLLLIISLAIFACLVSYGLLVVFGDFLPATKLIHKACLFFLILSIFPLKARLNLSWKDLGFAKKGLFSKQLIYGLGLSIVTLAPILFLLYGLDLQILENHQDWTIGKIIYQITIALLLALLISILEEPLFRGVLLTGLYRKFTLQKAIVLSSIYFSALHFVKSPIPLPYQQLSLNGCFQLIPLAFGQLLNPKIIGAFFALTMVGLFLAILRTRIADSLGWCIGCHAGWVWQLKVYKDFFDTNPESPYLYLVSGYDSIVSWLIGTWLVFVLAVYWLWSPRKLQGEVYEHV